MLHAIPGLLGCFMGIFGILTNLYILLVLLSNKKTRTTSEWILIHLSWCGIVSSSFHLCLLAPSILREKFILGSSSIPFCGILGSGLLVLQLVTIYSVCALSADRAIAIVYPLRYSQIATNRRIAVYFITVWILSIATMITALCLSSFQEFHSPQVQHSASVNAVHFDLSDHTSDDGYIYDYEEESHQILRPGLVAPTTANYNETYETIIGSSSMSGRDGFLDTTSGISDQDKYNVEDSTTGGGGGGGNMDSSGESVDTSKFVLNYSSNNNNNNNNHNNIHSNNNKNNEHGDGVVFVRRTEEDGGSSPTSERLRNLSFEFRPLVGICLPKVYQLSWPSVIWTTEWILVILIAPLCTLLVCDLAVLSIARRQSHRILLAMTMVTIAAQATVTRSKGMAPNPPTGLWMNNVPARSRASRAVCENMSTIIVLHLPLILILVCEAMTRNHTAPEPLMLIGSLSIFATPSFNALLYGIRARPLRTAYKSYLRKRLTNTTLQHEIQNRLSPVDGSPRPSSRAKSFRSSTPSPNSSPAQTPPRRLSTNDLRPPPNQLILTSSPSHDHLGRSGRHHHHDHHHHHHNDHHRPFDEESNSTARKVRSFLHIPSFPSQLDMQEFWSGLRRPHRSPTIVITHEIGIRKDISTSLLGTPPDAEQRL